MSIDQADRLWLALQSSLASSEKPKFDVANVAYYLGALIVIGAMGWFMNIGVQYQRRRHEVERRFREKVVPHIRALIPERALAD